MVYTGISDTFLAVAASFALFIAAVCLSTKKRFVRMLLKPLFSRFVPERYKGKLNITFHDFYAGLGMMMKKKKYLIASISLGIAAWLLSIFQHYLLAVSVGMDVTYILLLSIMPIITLLDTLPISFSGLGTREIALIFFLSFFGISTETVVSFSLLLLIFGYVLVGVAGFVFWLKDPVKIGL
jgi:uncharacterized protein (TIRG00374 family)